MEFVYRKKMPLWDVEETGKRSRLVLVGERLPVKRKDLQIMMCSSAGHKLTGAFAVYPPNLLLHTTELRSGGTEWSSNWEWCHDSCLQRGLCIDQDMH